MLPAFAPGFVCREYILFMSWALFFRSKVDALAEIFFLKKCVRAIIMSDGSLERVLDEREKKIKRSCRKALGGIVRKRYVRVGRDGDR